MKPTSAARAALARALPHVQARAAGRGDVVAFVAADTPAPPAAWLPEHVDAGRGVAVAVLERAVAAALVARHTPGLASALAEPPGDACCWCVLLVGRDAWVVPVVAVPTARGSRARN